MLLYLFLVILGGVCVLLFAPITVHSSWDGRKQITQVHYLGLRFSPKKIIRTKKPAKKKLKEKKRFRPAALMDGFSRFTLHDFRALPVFLQNLLKHSNIQVRHISVRIATPDPALTGVISGWMEAARACLPDEWPIRVETSFDDEIPMISYDVQAKVRPVMPLRDVLVLAVRLPWIRLAKFWRQARK